MKHLIRFVAVLAILISSQANAHMQETIGYEFEDYNLQMLRSVDDKEIQIGPLFFLGYDIHDNYSDCEIRSIPLKINEMEKNFSLAYFAEVVSFYRMLRNDIDEKKFSTYEKVGLFSSKKYETFASFPRLLSPRKGGKKSGDPDFDVGPQVTRRCLNFQNILRGLFLMKNWQKILMV